MFDIMCKTRVPDTLWKYVDTLEICTIYKIAQNNGLDIPIGCHHEKNAKQYIMNSTSSK